MLKGFKEFKSDKINEGNIYGYSYLTDEEEQRFKDRLGSYENNLKNIALQLDKIYNSVTSDSINDMVRNGDEYYENILDNIENLNDKASDSSSEIDKWLQSLGEEEYEDKWSGIDIVHYNLYIDLVRNKYSSLEKIIENIRLLFEIDLESFKNNSANIIIGDNNEPKRLD